MYSPYTISIGYGAVANSQYGIAIGYSASTSTGIAIGDYASAIDNEITLKAGNTEVKFTQGGATLNGNPIGGGGSSSTSTSSGMDWAALFAGDYYGYTTKYADCNTLDELTFTGDWRNELDATGAWNYNLKNFSEVQPSFSYWCDTWGNSNLISFNSFMPNVTNLEYSFQNCAYLESWNCPTPQCYYFQNTFTGCINLKHWRGSFSNTNTPQCVGMFGNDGWNCAQLDLASVQYIAQVIPYGNGNTITLGVSNILNGSYELEQALNELYNKSWSVEVIYSQNG